MADDKEKPPTAKEVAKAVEPVDVTQTVAQAHGGTDNVALATDPAGINPNITSVDVVEEGAIASGYVNTDGPPEARPYYVEKDSVLTGYAWGVPPGTIQGRFGVPPMTDELRESLDKAIEAEKGN